MSEQKLAEQPGPQRPLLPKQPEVNIGTAGHVDHGKCLGRFDYALIDGQPMNGVEIEALASKKGKLVSRLDGGEFYSMDDNSVVSIDNQFRPTEGRAAFYKEHYVGRMIDIRTATGRKILVTPVHPLLVNRDGVICWSPAGKLVQGDHLAILRTVPLPEDVTFSEPVEQMRREFDLVTWEEYQHLKLASEDFRNFSALDERQIDQVRILSGLSVKEFCRSAGIGEAAYKKMLQRMKLHSATRMRIVSALKKAEVQPISPGEFIVYVKKGRYHTRKLKSVEMDESLAKWLAFLWSEGSSTPRTVTVTQTVQKNMVREWVSVSKEKLGADVSVRPDGHYTISNKALVRYLSLKFRFNPGNELDSPIPSWVCKLPRRLKATFLRWFLTLDGEFDSHSGQVMLSQINEKNIVVISYLLHSFGILPRFGTTRHQIQNSIRFYPRLTISGRGDLEIFAKEIGFEDSRIQFKLDNYLRKMKRASKETNLSIPIDSHSVKRHLELIGLIREGRGRSKLPPAKDSTWYKAYEMALKSRRLSRKKLLLIIASVEEQLRRLEESLSQLGASSSGILVHISLSGISQSSLSAELGYSRRKLIRIMRRATGLELETLLAKVEEITRSRINSVESWLVQTRRLASTPLEFDRVETAEGVLYDGMVFDLSVPGPSNFIGGTSSIVCHNSTLTQSITGVWTSAHSEELRRGITIKVGYADAAFYKCSQDHGAASYSTSAKCPVCSKKTALLRAVSFVDCPGHESLMTNMLAGAFLMDGTILVIAANEPVPKPQTREHLQALQMLGMKRIVVAQNKVDLVTDAEAKKNYDAIKGFVANTVAADAPIVPISAQQKRNIDALIEALEEVVPTPKRDPKADALMYIVRSFDVNKPGMEVSALSGGVLGGSLVKGEMHVGDEIELKPGMVDDRTGKYVPVVTKITSLQTGAGAADRVGPGGLVAVGTQLDPTFTKGDQMVGSVIGKPGTLPPTWEHATLGVDLFETAVGSAELVKVEKVKPGENLRLNLGTASSPAVVTSARGDVIEVDLKKPAAVESGMRAAISRRIAERWRLIGSGVLK